MKVTGSGSPAYLTVRFREREIPGLEVELHERLRDAEAAVRDGTDLERVDRRSAEEVLGATRRLLQQLADPSDTKATESS
ncbi:hypothetical protein [Conexibacter woesei]|uniref:hypothetical protein n=1 Tax=Conexibacter woesei TaxID=191495 RepID=UPI00041AB1CF|nr:hypothetical protein [Conexibacter woesei]